MTTTRMRILLSDLDVGECMVRDYLRTRPEILKVDTRARALPGKNLCIPGLKERPREAGLLEKGLETCV